jgi:hypothetical protein
MIPRRQKRDGFDDAWVEAGDQAAAEQEERGAAAAAGQLHLKGKHLFSVGTFEHDILDSLAPQVSPYSIPSIQSYTCASAPTSMDGLASVADWAGG